MTDWLRYAEGIPPFSGKLNIVLFIPSLIPAFVEKKKESYSGDKFTRISDF